MKLINIGEKGYLVDVNEFNKVTTVDECDNLLERELEVRTRDNIVVGEDCYKELVEKKRASLTKKVEDKQQIINKLKVELATARRAMSEVEEIRAKVAELEGVINHLNVKHGEELQQIEETHTIHVSELQEHYESALELKDKELAEYKSNDNELITSLKAEVERLRKVESAFEVQIQNITKAHEERAINFDKVKSGYKDKIHGLNEQLKIVVERKDKLEEQVRDQLAHIKDQDERIRSMSSQIQQYKVAKEKSDFVIQKSAEYYDDYTEFLETIGKEFIQEFETESTSDEE